MTDNTDDIDTGELAPPQNETTEIATGDLETAPAVDEAKPPVAIKYVGPRPFRQAAGDEPLHAGDIVGPGHKYEPIIGSLIERADFVEVTNG